MALSCFWFLKTLKCIGMCAKCSRSAAYAVYWIQNTNIGCTFLCMRSSLALFNRYLVEISKSEDALSRTSSNGIREIYLVFNQSIMKVSEL